MVKKHIHSKEEWKPRAQYNYALRVLPTDVVLPEKLDPELVKEERDQFAKHMAACPPDIHSFAQNYKKLFNPLLTYLDMYAHDPQLRDGSRQLARDYAMEAWDALKAGFEPELAREQDAARKLEAKQGRRY